MTSRFFIRSSALLVTAGIIVRGQSPAALRVLSPGPNDVVSGPTHFSADVAPAGVAVRQIEFYVDGTRQCVASERPYQCDADVGTRNDSASVRVVATLSDDQRLVQSIRTKAPGLRILAQIDAVLVTVHVSDDHGRRIGGLRPEDFRILEDGQPQEVTSFAADDAATSLCLALDTSGSMTEAVADLRRAARDFLSALRATDHVTIASFNSRLFVLADPKFDLTARLAALDRLQPQGMTALYDVLIQATNLTEHEEGRRAIVVFTDGDDDASLSSLDSVRTTLGASDVVLYLIARGKAAENEKLRQAWTDVAVSSGGNAYFGKDMSHLSDHFAEIRDELASGYLLGYVPKHPLGDSTWRKLEVTLPGRKNLRVHAREGYYAARRSPGTH